MYCNVIVHIAFNALALLVKHWS